MIDSLSLLSATTVNVIEKSCQSPKLDPKQLYRTRRNRFETNEELLTFAVERTKKSDVKVDVNTSIYCSVGDYTHFIQKITKGGQMLPDCVRCSDILIGVNGQYALELDKTEVVIALYKAIESGRLVLDVARRSSIYNPTTPNYAQNPYINQQNYYLPRNEVKTPAAPIEENKKEETPRKVPQLDAKELYRNSGKKIYGNEELLTFTYERTKELDVKIDVDTSIYGSIGNHTHFIQRITKGGQLQLDTVRSLDKLIGVNGQYAVELNKTEVVIALYKAIESGRLVLDVARTRFVGYNPTSPNYALNPYQNYQNPNLPRTEAKTTSAPMEVKKKEEPVTFGQKLVSLEDENPNTAVVPSKRLKLDRLSAEEQDKTAATSSTGKYTIPPLLKTIIERAATKSSLARSDSEEVEEK